MDFEGLSVVYQDSFNRTIVELKLGYAAAS